MEQDRIEYKLGEISGTLKQLVKKVDHNCKQSEKGDNEIKEILYSFKQEYDKKLIQHEDYHNKNEAKWGIIKVMSDKPYLGIVVGIFIAILFGMTIDKLVVWLKLLI